MDGGDGRAQVPINEFEAGVVEQAARRTHSDPDSDPLTGAMLGTGEAGDALEPASPDSDAALGGRADADR